MWVYANNKVNITYIEFSTNPLPHPVPTVSQIPYIGPDTEEVNWRATCNNVLGLKLTFWEKRHWHFLNW